MGKLPNWLRKTGMGLAGGLFVAIPAAMLLWQDRDSFDEVDIEFAESAEAYPDAVTATWFGVTTLLFDDGETQILIDGFFSRPSILDLILRRPIASNAANINYALDEFRMRRLAAVIPVHSHYDHAMDVGAIANRTSASVVGTESTANIARGAGVPSDQIILVSNGDSLQFGKFSVTFIASRHVPNGFGDSHFLAGYMSEPLRQPAVFTAWREGGSWSLLIEHPNGTTLVQGSAGLVGNALAPTDVDVVMLSVANLYGQGIRYAQAYWQQLVVQTGAERVYAIHYDDITQPLGQIRLTSNALDPVGKTLRWLREFSAAGEDRTALRLLPFGKPLVLY